MNLQGLVVKKRFPAWRGIGVELCIDFIVFMSVHPIQSNARGLNFYGKFNRDLDFSIFTDEINVSNYVCISIFMKFSALSLP